MNSHILPLLAIVAAIGIFFGYVNPAWSGSVADTEAAIAAAEEALAAADQYALRQRELIDARDAMDPADLERLSAFLPDSVDNVGLILDLTTLASKNGLALSNIDVTGNNTGSTQGSGVSGALPASGTNPIGSVDLSLTALGTYAALQEFLVGVEKSERLLDVRDLVIKGSDSGVYTYQLILRLYWLR